MATFNVSGDDTTVRFEYTSTTAKIQAVVGDAAEYLWSEETDFADATNQEKLDVVDTYVKRVLVELANTHKSQKAQKVAREAEAADEHSI